MRTIWNCIGWFFNEMNINNFDEIRFLWWKSITFMNIYYPWYNYYSIHIERVKNNRRILTLFFMADSNLKLMLGLSLAKINPFLSNVSQNLLIPGPSIPNKCHNYLVWRINHKPIFIYKYCSLSVHCILYLLSLRIKFMVQ